MSKELRVETSSNAQKIAGITEASHMHVLEGGWKGDLVLLPSNKDARGGSWAPTELVPEKKDTPPSSLEECTVSLLS